MPRSRNYTVAAILAALLSLTNFTTALLLLPRGSAALAAEGNQPPYAVIILKLLIGAFGVLAAYGAFRVQRWGIVLTLVLMVLGVLAALPGIAFAPTVLSQVSSAITVVAGGIVVWLLLRRDARAFASVNATR
jgi:hypothetical protein